MPLKPHCFPIKFAVVTGRQLGLVLFNPLLLCIVSHYFSVSIAIRLLDYGGIWVGSPAGTEIRLFFIPSRPTLGPTLPDIQWLSLSAGPLQPDRGADHSSPSTDEVKNVRRHVSAPPYGRLFVM
jgi:hypothetical protein